MHIDAEAFLSGSLMEEEARGLRLVWSFVLRKPDVAIDAEHRAFRIGHQIWTDVPQPRSNASNKGQHRLANVFYVTRLVRFEPFPLVVGLQLSQKIEK